MTKQNTYVCAPKFSSVVLRKKYENHNSLKVSLRIEMKINKKNFKIQSNFICIPATEIRNCIAAMQTNQFKTIKAITCEGWNWFN